MSSDSAGKPSRVLLSGVFGPFGVDDAWGRKENIMELFHNQVTKAQGAASFRFHHRSFGLYFLAENVDADVTVLDFPSRERFVDELKRCGMRIREYGLGPGERVACTLGRDDDAVVSRLRVPLAGVGRVDALQSLDLHDGRVRQWRLEDVPFDPAAGEVLALPSAAALRRLPAHTLVVRLVAVDAAGERPLGAYTFAHAPA